MLEDVILSVKSNEDNVEKVCFEDEIVTQLDISKIDFESVQFTKC